ncbi:MAG: TonB-dependent receptor, partial [Acidobacteria bacterium]|nr:TonB-dependent receptor [Acidobacteriota bacterium]
MTISTLYVAVVATSAIAAPAQPTTPVLRDTIVVTAERSPESRDEIAAAVSLLTRKEIAQLPADDLADLLQFLPGVALVGDSEGARPQLMSRGFFGGGEVEYIQLRVDGVPLGDPRSGLAEWRSIPVEAIERVEMLHGPASSLYGDVALGGVVEVFTRPAHGRVTGGVATAQLESPGTTEGRFSWRHGGAREGGVTLSISKGEGDRHHSDLEVAGAVLNFGSQLGSGRISARALVDAHEREDPGWLPLEMIERDPQQSDDLFRFDREENRSINASIQLTYPGTLPVDFMLYGVERDQTLVRTLLLAPGFGDRADRDTASRTAGITFTSSTTGTVAGRNNELRGGIDAGWDEIDTRYFSVTGEGERGEQVSSADGERSRLALFLTDSWDVSSRARVTAGVRYDAIEDRFGQESSHTAWSPRVAVNLRRGSEDAPMAIFASWSRAFRAPTLDQLFDPRPFPDFAGGSFTISNPELQPQRAINTEFGVSQTVGTLRWSSTIYRTTVDDEIDFDVRTFRYLNIGRSRHRGVEAELGSEELELVAFEVVDRYPAPALGGADHGGEGQLHGGLLAYEPGDDLGAPAFLLEGPLGQVGGAHPDAVPDRHPVDGQQRLAVLAEAGHRRG